MLYSLQLLTSLTMDSFFGDPRWYPHPVKGIGFLIERFENLTRQRFANITLAGGLTFSLVLLTTFTIVYTLLFLSSLLSSVFESTVAILLIYMALSTRDLIVHSNRVYTALTSETLEQARKEVGMIVGRDTTELSEDQVARACVETVAENMVDGATAPLFFAVAASFLSPLLPLTPISCSALGIFLYKAVNTMDSMIGYKNDKYLEFGRIAAKGDDFINFVPARLSGLCIVATAFLLRLDWKNSLRIYLRDRNNHSSPNAAHPEAAVAGCLGVELGGPSTYFGKIVEKPTIGDRFNPIGPEKIKEANRLVIFATLGFAICLLLFRLVLDAVIS